MSKLKQLDELIVFSVSTNDPDDPYIFVQVRKSSIKIYGERNAVTHEAWNHMWNHDSTKFHLRAMCRILPTPDVKARFRKNLVYLRGTVSVDQHNHFVGDATKAALNRRAKRMDGG